MGEKAERKDHFVHKIYLYLPQEKEIASSSWVYEYLHQGY